MNNHADSNQQLPSPNLLFAALAQMPECIRTDQKQPLGFGIDSVIDDLTSSET